MSANQEARTALEAVVRGDRGALARTITAIQDGTEHGSHLVDILAGCARPDRVVGITGPAGAGKSTLVGALIPALVGRGLKTAAVMVDPTSPISGGAVLGDRIRLQGADSSRDTFVRSLAHRGSVGGIAPEMEALVPLFGAAGYQFLIIETVGSGQAETAITSVVDTTLYVEPPGLGDGVQAMKAGLAEVADVLVVSKCELPGAAQLMARWRSQIRRDAARDRRSVIAVSVPGGIGIEDLVATIVEGPLVLERRTTEVTQS
jgi:LAO/AO transport system ATPase